MLKKLWGLPAHPVYVHFPVALFTLSGFFLLLHLMDGKGHRLGRFLKKIGIGPFDFESLSFFLILLGFGMGVVAVASGLALVDGWQHVPVPHGFLGLATMVCYFLTLVIRWVFGPSLYSQPLRFLYYGLNLLGLVLICLTGFEGGELHYR